MIYFRRLSNWLLRAWPLWGFVAIGVLHFVALREFAQNTVFVNKLVGMALQLTGGLLIIYAINENLGLFRRQSLWAAITSWARAFPLKSKSITLQANGAASASATGALGSVIVGRSTSTVEERVAELERLLGELRRDLSTQIGRVSARIETVQSELGSRIELASGKIDELSQRIEKVTVGGFKIQAFGVVLAIYGAITSVFA